MFEGSYFFFVFVASSNKKKSTSSPPPWCDKVTQSEENRLFHACFNRRASDRVALLTFHFLPGPITIGSDRVFRSDLNNAKHGASILAHTPLHLRQSRSISLTTTPINHHLSKKSAQHCQRFASQKIGPRAVDRQAHQTNVNKPRKRLARAV
uniref:(northern house mosquito) hypothetical protein n=1 Tax=Culex pipiens TaxID=7175 RepID=A0A8D8F398_CULPI